jgi:DNA-binding response OmpR family regulator
MRTANNEKENPRQVKKEGVLPDEFDIRRKTPVPRPAPTPRTARIALAEDDRQMRSLVAESLRADGHTVIELVDGAQLLVRLARQYRLRDPEETIDLVVSDIRMPILTGLSILKGLRDARCETPVVLMTAFADSPDRQAALDLGAVVFDKPFKMADLRSAVRALLARRPADTS